MNRLLRKIRGKVVQKTATQKTYEAYAAKGYNPNPTVSFVIQAFNKSGSILSFVPILRQFPNSEIIVLDDGSGPTHTTALIHALTGANEFVLRSNDLYEVVTYDRALGYARGKYVALLQDDDGIDEIEWVKEAVALFEKYPKLAILGGRGASRPMATERVKGAEMGAYEIDGEIGTRKNLFRSHYLGTATGKAKSFMFAHTVNRAPMWIRREAFVEQLKHIDQEYRPFQGDDAEICLRAWTLGLQVGWYPTQFRISQEDVSGMRTWNNKLIERQNLVNYARLYDAYESRFAEIDALVNAANKEAGIALPNFG